ncbi:MAG TPA: hypothetical protein VN865_00880 [Candidatus Acidoferrales bacterium]|jgi:hypothetical protein|nr:hypothetical protein [Candidatus Acidoferrales bacterium]
MKSIRIAGMIALAALIAAATVHAQSEADANTSSVSASDSAAVPAAAPSPAAKKTLRQKVGTLIAKLTPDRIKRDVEFRKASALFPAFCKHWEQDLHDREVNNLSNLQFVEKQGFQTATYTGYGKVAECESHQSKDGYSIGRITYEEFVYYIAGKSEDEARHAPPKPVSDTHTTEIFRWDNGKWFY